jgi:hypothetical protein
MIKKNELYELPDGKEIYYVDVHGIIEVWYKIRHGITNKSYTECKTISAMPDVNGCLVFYYIDKAEALRESLKYLMMRVEKNKEELAEIDNKNKKEKP